MKMSTISSKRLPQVDGSPSEVLQFASKSTSKSPFTALESNNWCTQVLKIVNTPVLDQGVDGASVSEHGWSSKYVMKEDELKYNKCSNKSPPCGYGVVEL